MPTKIPVPSGPKPVTARPARPKAASPGSKTVQKVASGVVRGVVASQGERIGIYGSGGIGKTELAASLSNVGIEPLFIDLDQGSMGLDVARAVSGDDQHLTRTFAEVRSVLQNHELISQFGAVVIDTFTTLEDRVRDHVIATIPHEKGKPISSIEDYGFGKGLSHVFDQSLLVLADLEAICRLGVHVVVICHQVSEKVPSVESEDFLEYQPRLQSPGKTAKLRERMFEWCNHFFRVDFDRYVEGGKVATTNKRSINTVKTTTAWAKHRTMPNGNEFAATIPFDKGTYELWTTMFGEQ
jgi:hypothetical protein